MINDEMKENLRLVGFVEEYLTDPVDTMELGVYRRWIDRDFSDFSDMQKAEICLNFSQFMSAAAHVPAIDENIKRYSSHIAAFLGMTAAAYLESAEKAISDLTSNEVLLVDTDN